MENKIALIGIIVEESSAAEKVNGVLHGFADYIIGRMGIPYRSRGLNVISVVIDAPQKTISTIAGRLGMIDGISVKTVNARV